MSSFLYSFLSSNSAFFPCSLLLTLSTAFPAAFFTAAFAPLSLTSFLNSAAFPLTVSAVFERASPAFLAASPAIFLIPPLSSTFFFISFALLTTASFAFPTKLFALSLRPFSENSLS